MSKYQRLIDNDENNNETNKTEKGWSIWGKIACGFVVFLVVGSIISVIVFVVMQKSIVKNAENQFDNMASKFIKNTMNQNSINQ